MEGAAQGSRIACVGLKILIINPNTTAAMTRLVASHLQRALPHAQLVEATAPEGDAVIATQKAFDAAAVTSVRMLRHAIEEGAAFDAVLLACFGDPGLEAMRTATSRPVTGLAWASMQQAEKAGTPYAVVTAGQPWQAILTRRFTQWGASSLFKGVELVQATGLSVLEDPLGALTAVLRAISQAQETGAKQVILGGSVFAGHKDLISQQGLRSDHLADCVQAAALQLS